LNFSEANVGIRLRKVLLGSEKGFNKLNRLAWSLVGWWPVFRAQAAPEAQKNCVKIGFPDTARRAEIEFKLQETAR
jgi:hypothetical protein